MKNTTRRIASLDGIRAVSISLVLLSHFINCLGYNDPLVLGNLGVRVFFVISGFLISGLLIRELEDHKTIDLRRFYFRRTLRIFPPYYFFIAVMACLASVQIVKNPLSSFLPVLTYTSNYVSTGAWNLAHSWSLSVEEQFYLIFPGILFLFGRKRLLAVLALVVLASPIIRVACYQFMRPAEPLWLFDGFQANMDALAAGCILAFTRSRLYKSALYHKLITSKIVLLLVPLLLLANVQGQHPNIYQGACISFMNVGITLLVDWMVTNSESVIGRILNSRALVQVGVMSYSIYLWQQPFLERGSPLSVASHPLNLFWLVIGVGFSYWIIERYSLRFRGSWEHRVRRMKRLKRADGHTEPNEGMAAFEV
jgi:peptidoglycan/LPS O-acetylase OafA/YrhL